MAASYWGSVRTLSLAFICTTLKPFALSCCSSAGSASAVDSPLIGWLGYPRPVRVASLLPSATEIVCALGARAELVGRSHECDFPAEARALPVVSKPALSLSGLSRSSRGSRPQGKSYWLVRATCVGLLAPTRFFIIYCQHLNLRRTI